jgi:hypothetical protein
MASATLNIVIVVFKGIWTACLLASGYSAIKWPGKEIQLLNLSQQCFVNSRAEWQGDDERSRKNMEECVTYFKVFGIVYSLTISCTGGAWFLTGNRILSLLPWSNWLLDPPSLVCNGYGDGHTRARTHTLARTHTHTYTLSLSLSLFLWDVKWLKHRTYHLLQFNAVITNAWSFTATPPAHLHYMMLRHMENYTFTF